MEYTICDRSEKRGGTGEKGGGPGCTRTSFESKRRGEHLRKYFSSPPQAVPVQSQSPTSSLQNTDNHIHTSNRIFTVGLQTLLMHSFGCVTEHSCRCSKLRTLRQRYYVHKRSWRRKYISPKLRPAGLPQNKLHCVRSRHTTGSLDAADKNSHVLAIRHQFHSLWPNALFTHHLFVLQLPSCSLCEFGTEPT